MNLHANAALSLNKRRQLARRVVGQKWTLAEAASAAEVSVRTAQKWSSRSGRKAKAADRSLLDARLLPARDAEDRVQAIAALRRLRLTGAEIAEVLAMAETTVSGILKRIGMGRGAARARAGAPLGALTPRRARARRRQEARPDHPAPATRRLAAALPSADDQEGKEGLGVLHIGVDDATRLAYVEVLGDERAVTAIAFFRRALRFFARYGIKVERVMSDNGACYRAKLHALCCQTLGIRHLFTRPYRPQTNGKAERFIRTMLEGWAYGGIYRSSSERTAPLTAGSSPTTIAVDTEPSGESLRQLGSES